MTWGEEVALQRIRRCAARGGTRLKLKDLALQSVPDFISVIPDALADLKQLTGLFLRDDQLVRVPDWIGELRRVAPTTQRHTSTLSCFGRQQADR